MSIFEVDKGSNALTYYRHNKYAAGNGEEGGKKDAMGQMEKILF